MDDDRRRAMDRSGLLSIQRGEGEAEMTEVKSILKGEVVWMQSKELPGGFEKYLKMWETP